MPKKATSHPTLAKTVPPVSEGTEPGTAQGQTLEIRDIRGSEASSLFSDTGL